MGVEKIILKYRLDENRKQDYVCAKTGMPHPNYSQIESGKVKPKLEKLEKIAGVYGKTAAQFLQEAGEVKVEHHNHPNSNNQSKNGKFYGENMTDDERGLLRENIASLQKTVAAQEQTIIAQGETITAQKAQIVNLLAEVERLRGL